MELNSTEDRLSKENERLKKLVTLLESVIQGDKNKIGLFSCYDTYYKGCWNKRLIKAKKLKKKLRLKQTGAYL